VATTTTISAAVIAEEVDAAITKVIVVETSATIRETRDKALLKVASKTSRLK